MADLGLMPLSPPRSPGADEARFCREQAEVFRALQALPGPVLVTLLPACFECGSDQLVHLHAACEYACRDCGYRTDAIELRSGRLANR